MESRASPADLFLSNDMERSDSYDREDLLAQLPVCVGLEQLSPVVTWLVQDSESPVFS